ncbi:MAG: hypothetical protein AAGH57_01265 [Pseudomonadota bacterium]
MRKSTKRSLAIGCVINALCVQAGSLHAQDVVEEVCDEQCQATRDAQDVTAAVNGVFLSNAIGFGPDSENTLYNFQIQPIATVARGEWGDAILRGITPVLGVPIPDQGADDLNTEWGLSDTVVQALYVPGGQDGLIRFGIGPQVSLATHTQSSAQSGGWGGGIAGGAFGFAGPLAFGGIANHLWGEDGYSTTTVQPIVYYNLETPGIGPWFFGYNAPITYDWDAEDGDAWEIPVGATVGKTVVLPSRDSLQFAVGGYYLAEAPTNGNDWQLRFSINFLLN